MAVATYSELQDACATLLKRSDLTSVIQQSIALAESELQVRCKNLEFETTANIAVTSGVGTLPTGWLGARSVYWADDINTPLAYVDPGRFDAMSDNDGTPGYYTVTGSSIKFIPSDTGTAVATYRARFTPLSDSNTSNSLLANFPDAYLYGALKHVCVYTEDDQNMQKYGVLFNAACDRISVDDAQRKYGAQLAVKAR